MGIYEGDLELCFIVSIDIIIVLLFSFKLNCFFDFYKGEVYGFGLKFCIF